MRNNGYNFGGEQSGHLVFLSHPTPGDCILPAPRLLAVMVRKGKPLSELAVGSPLWAVAKVWARTSQVLLDIAVEKKVPLDQLPDVLQMLADIERQLGDDGRVLVRSSGFFF